jgi:hypothetical protein
VPSSHGGEGEVHGLLMRAFCRHSHPCHPPMLSQIARDMSLDGPTHGAGPGAPTHGSDPEHASDETWWCESTKKGVASECEPDSRQTNVQIYKNTVDHTLTQMDIHCSHTLP